MRQINFLMVLLLTVITCVEGLDDTDTAAQVVIPGTGSNHTHRRLKGNSDTDKVDTDEERVSFRKMASFFKAKNPSLGKALGTNTGLSKEVEVLQKNTALVNSIKTNPVLKRFSTAIAKDPTPLTEKKLERIGSVVAKRKGVGIETGEKFKKIAWAVVLLGLFGLDTYGLIQNHSSGPLFPHTRIGKITTTIPLTVSGSASLLTSVSDNLSKT